MYVCRLDAPSSQPPLARLSTLSGEVGDSGLSAKALIRETHMYFIQASYGITMARAPAVGTLWILSVARMELVPSIFSILCFAIYLQGAGFKLVV